MDNPTTTSQDNAQPTLRERLHELFAEVAQTDHKLADALHETLGTFGLLERRVDTEFGSVWLAGLTETALDSAQSNLEEFVESLDEDDSRDDDEDDRANNGVDALEAWCGTAGDDFGVDATTNAPDADPNR